MQAKNLTPEIISSIVHMARQQWKGEDTYTTENIVERFMNDQELSDSVEPEPVKVAWKPTMTEKAAAEVLTMLPIPPTDGVGLNDWAVQALQMLDAVSKGTGHADVQLYTRKVKSIGNLVSTLESEDGSQREMTMHAYADGSYGIKIKFQKPKANSSMLTSFVLSPEGFQMLQDMLNSREHFLPMWASYAKHLQTQAELAGGLNACA